MELKQIHLTHTVHVLNEVALFHKTIEGNGVTNTLITSNILYIAKILSTERKLIF